MSLEKLHMWACAAHFYDLWTKANDKQHRMLGDTDLIRYSRYRSAVYVQLSWISSNCTKILTCRSVVQILCREVLSAVSIHGFKITLHRAFYDINMYSSDEINYIETEVVN